MQQRLDQPVLALNFGSSPRGNILSAWTHVAAPQFVRATLWDVEAETWTAVQDIEAEPGGVNIPGLSVDDAGHGVLSWQKASGAARARFDRTAGWEAAEPDSVARLAAISPDGRVLGVWSDGADVQYAWLFSGADEWSPPQVLQANATALRVLAVGNQFVVLSAAGGTLRSHVFSDSIGWRTQTLTIRWGGGISPSARVSVADQLIVAWTTTDEAVETTSWSASNWLPLSQLDAGENLFWTAVGANSSSEAIACWLKGAETWATWRSASGVWNCAMALGPNNPPESLGPACVIDDAGNAVVAWTTGGRLHWRRYVAAVGWEAEVIVPTVVASHVFVAGQPSGEATLLWPNDTGLWTARFE